MRGGTTSWSSRLTLRWLSILAIRMEMTASGAGVSTEPETALIRLRHEVMLEMVCSSTTSIDLMMMGFSHRQSGRMPSTLRQSMGQHF